MSVRCSLSWQIKSPRICGFLPPARTLRASGKRTHSLPGMPLRRRLALFSPPGRRQRREVQQVDGYAAGLQLLDDARFFALALRGSRGHGIKALQLKHNQAVPVAEDDVAGTYHDSAKDDRTVQHPKSFLGACADRQTPAEYGETATCDRFDVACGSVDSQSCDATTLRRDRQYLAPCAGGEVAAHLRDDDDAARGRGHRVVKHQVVGWGAFHRECRAAKPGAGPGSANGRVDHTLLSGGLEQGCRIEALQAFDQVLRRRSHIGLAVPLAATTIC